jgi:uncharacterized protein
MASASKIEKSESQTLITEKIRRFFTDKPVRKVWLFGSFARGDFDQDSDIDILVAWDYAAMSIGWEYFGWWADLETLTGRKVDLVSEGYVSKYISPMVEREKVLIYEKN